MGWKGMSGGIARKKEGYIWIYDSDLEIQNDKQVGD